MKKIFVLFLALLKIKNWQDYLADYFKVKKHIFAYNLRDGTKYAIRGGTNDRNIFNEVVIHKIYTPKGFEIKNGDIVADIGAHIGIFSIFASKNAAKVYSFEPVNENFELLEKNKDINQSSNIVDINKAVSSKTETRTLFLDKGNKGGHSFFEDNSRGKNISVQTISFEEFWKQNNILKLDFLKIDCEGGEYEILFNCPKNILEKIDKISMEYHNIDEKYDVDALQKFLKDNNFKVKVVLKYNMLYAKH